MTDIQTVQQFLHNSFGRLDHTLHGIKEDELDWRCCPESNTIRNILTHIMVEWYERDARTVAGNKDAEVSLPISDSKWNSLSLDQMRSYLEDGKGFLVFEIDKLSNDDLELEINWFIGKRTRGEYFIHGIGEKFHHEGQIAAIRGALHRQRNRI
jgi:hypothetical protein